MVCAVASVSIASESTDKKARKRDPRSVGNEGTMKEQVKDVGQVEAAKPTLKQPTTCRPGAKNSGCLATHLLVPLHSHAVATAKATTNVARGAATEIVR